MTDDEARDRWTGLGANMRLEITAEAFRVMTGHMAPYKSASIASYPASDEDRHRAYEAWIATYGECVRAVMRAFNEMRPAYEPDK